MSFTKAHIFNPMDLWVNILEKLRNNNRVVLLYVVQSKGSSPGRAGFAMYVSDDGHMYGSVGGGIMEHKLVTFARTLLSDDRVAPILKHQIHRDDVGKNRSGLICSGQQSVVLLSLDATDADEVQACVQSLKNNGEIELRLNQDGLSFQSTLTSKKQQFDYQNENDWSYSSILSFEHKVFIAGGGHVGLALSEVMNRLGFYVTLLDDREDINTIQKNKFAHRIIQLDYNQINEFIPDHPSSYVVVMTFGYRSDEVCIKQLIGRTFKYFGVMGSASKMKKMWESLLEQGYDQSQLDQIHTPIGLPIHSKTPMEIAVSVAAQIVGVKNRL